MKFQLSDFQIFQSFLPDYLIKDVTGRIINGLYLDDEVTLEQKADVTYDFEIPVGRVPKSVVKMTASKYQKAFLNEGEIQLGTFDYYRKHENAEVNDPFEGSFLLVQKSFLGTSVANVTGGYNYYTFCTYLGSPDSETLDKFKYDSAYEIFDIPAFAEAVGRSISARSFHFSECVYKKDKVIVGHVEFDYNQNRIDSRVSTIAAEAKYFVKPEKFSHQREFRFIWEMERDVEQPTQIIVCPEATKFCRNNFLGASS